MTGPSFSAWVDLMKATKGWSKLKCARELGCSKNQIAVWCENGAPTYIGLACNALYYGMAEWEPRR